MSDLRDRAVQLYDAFTHDHGDRRELLRRMTLLAGSAAAAEAMIGAIAASPAAAAIVAPADPRLRTTRVRFAADGRALNGYLAMPRATKGPLGAVIVVHENRGLTPHIEDVARRIALDGFIAFAPDFLSDQGGTPRDEDRARDLIGTVDYDAILREGLAAIARLKTMKTGTGKVGVIGFCWGGAYVNRLAVTAGDALAAGVSYYGPAPAPTEAAKVRTPLMIHLPEKDARVAATARPWIAALTAAGKRVEAHVYPGVDHAFNNDTSAERYDKAAADLAWSRTTAFLHAHLDRHTV